MWAAIVAFCKAFSPLLIKISELLARLLQPLIDLIDFIRSYLELKKQRIKNAIEAEVEAKLKAKSEQWAKENANVKAFDLIEEEAWKDRYKTILRFIQEEKPELVLQLTKLVDNNEINSFLFNKDMTPEYKSVKIVKIMQGKE